MAIEADADWSGYAPPPSKKKHIPQPASNIQALGGVGFGPIKGDDAWKPGRKVTENGSNVSSTSILGGPVQEKASNWQTEAQAASAQTKTSREQLTECGRSMFVRGKQSTTPAYELARPFDESVGARRLSQENPFNLNDHAACKEGNEENDHPNSVEASDSSYSLVGFRSRGGARSFLEGLGIEVAAAGTSSNDE